jgi:hypothetical protein
MGSGFDDWVYWHFFTITVNYNSPQTELLLNDVCLTNPWRISGIREWTPFYNCQRTVQRSPPPRVPLLLLVNALSRKRAWTVPYQTDNSVSNSTVSAFRRCLKSRCLANDLSSLSRKRVMASHYLAMGYSGFQASCHNTKETAWACERANGVNEPSGSIKCTEILRIWAILGLSASLFNVICPTLGTW